MSVFANVFGNNKTPTAKVGVKPQDVRLSLIGDAAPLALTPEMIVTKPAEEKITFENIAGVILRVRTNELIGKGKLSKDEYLADSLFSLVRHYEPDTRLTYELVEKAIAFVKRNPIMGAGKWSKEEHLSEYLYATIRLSRASAANTPSATAPETEAAA